MFRTSTILIIAAILLGFAGGASAIRHETFDSGLGDWVEHDAGSQIPTPCWSNTNNAQGASGPGELGGTFTRQASGIYPYIADETMFGVDFFTPLPIKFQYRPIDIPDGDRDTHITIGYMDTTRRRHSIFWIQVARWSDDSGKSGQIYVGDGQTGMYGGDRTLPGWGVQDNNVCVVDLMYYFNGKEAVVKGKVYGTTIGTLDVDIKCPIPPCTADAFGLMIQSAASEEHPGRQCKLYVDDITYGGPEAENIRRPNPSYFAEDIPRNTLLSWEPGAGATEHDVYFGVEELAVKNATTSSPEYKGRQTALSYDPVGPIAGTDEDLLSGTTYYWRIDEVAGSTVTKGFVISFTTTTSARSQYPGPANTATRIGRDVVLDWTAGVGAVSHDVYFGDNKAIVAIANRSWTQYFKGNQDLNNTTYDPPGILDLGRTYYWRVDEVDPYTTHKGDIWEFTLKTGQANNPAPGDKQVSTTTPVMGWQIGAGEVVSHNVYLGTDYTAVYNATTGSAQYKGNFSEPVFDPGTLSDATRYYWRVDEIGDENVLPALVGSDGAVKGPVWTFVTPGYALLQVDLASPHKFQPGDPSLVQYRSDTGKEGWTIWPDQRWWDLYMHDWVNYPNIGDTGINAALSTVYDGEGGLKVHGMYMLNKAGGDAEGYPQGDPIANSWYYAVDHVNAPRSSIVLCLQKMPPGQYSMRNYHNYWEPCSGNVREKTECGNDYGQGMQFVRAMSMKQAGAYYAGAEHDIVPVMTNWAEATDQTEGVVSIADAVNVMPTHTTNDASVKTSMIEFSTDGSPLIVAYEAAPYQDTGDQYKGPRGVLNAFEILADNPIYTAGRPVPYNGETGIQPGVVNWTSGGFAVWHEVYCGTDATAVAGATKSSAEYKGTLPRGTETYDGRFKLNTTYYWRIDEIGPDGTVWPGDVWSFSTAQCLFIEQFEDDFDWTGFGASAMTEDYITYVKTSTDNPHGGSRSMEIEYYNASPYTYSEAGRTFDHPQDWLSGPGGLLGLYFRGKAGNVSDRMYVIVEDSSGAAVEISHTPDLTTAAWQAWGIPLEDLSGIDLTQVKKVFIGTGNRGGSPSKATGFLYVDDMGLCRGRCVTGPSQDLTGDCLVNFEDHAVKASGWGGSMLSYKALAEQWLEETLVWP